MLSKVDELPELLSNIDEPSGLSNLFNQVGSLLGNIPGTEEVVKYLRGISNIIGQIDGLVNLFDDIDSPQDALNAISGLLGTGGGLAREVVVLLGGDDFEVDDDSDDSDDDSGDDDNDFAGDDDGDDDLDDDSDDSDGSSNSSNDLEVDDDDFQSGQLGSLSSFSANALLPNDDNEDVDDDNSESELDDEGTWIAANPDVVSALPLRKSGGDDSGEDEDSDNPFARADDIEEGDFELGSDGLLDEEGETLDPESALDLEDSLDEGDLSISSDESDNLPKGWGFKITEEDTLEEPKESLVQLLRKLEINEQTWLAANISEDDNQLAQAIPRPIPPRPQTGTSPSSPRQALPYLTPPGYPVNPNYPSNSRSSFRPSRRVDPTVITTPGGSTDRPPSSIDEFIEELTEQLSPSTSDPAIYSTQESDGPFRDFFHGSSLESIDNIIRYGVNENQGRANTGGGRVNIPGSFFTIEATEPEALQLAYGFGLNRAEQPAVLVMRLPEDVFFQLKAAGVVTVRPIAGVPGTNETIFRPASFGVLNRFATFPQIVDPYGKR